MSDGTVAAVSLRSVSTAGLSEVDLAAIRALLLEAFADDELGGFDEDDWLHALGGTHLVLEASGEIVGHAAVVERELHVAGRPLRVGYVEAVAVQPQRQRTGLGTRLMSEVSALIVERGFELGALGTGSHAFYERLGWRTWRGPSSVRTDDGERPTPDEDGFILVLRTPASPPLHLTDPISCDWRSGDVW